MPRRKQTRRSISISGKTYKRLKAFCTEQNFSMAGWVESLIKERLPPAPEEPEVLKPVERPSLISTPVVSKPPRTKPPELVKTKRPIIPRVVLEKPKVQVALREDDDPLKEFFPTFEPVSPPTPEAIEIPEPPQDEEAIPPSIFLL